MDKRTKNLMDCGLEFNVDGINFTKYTVETISVQRDGKISVPLRIIYRKDLLSNDGSNPCFLSAYGAYGSVSSTIKFSSWDSDRFSLLDRGWIIASASVRGGGEKGQMWHNAGRGMNKMNSFHDFIACTNELINLNYTSAKRVCISGGSAGGLLVGAVLNMAPHLYACAIADVPFVDVVNSLSDPTLSSTVAEWKEWGNPLENPEALEYLSKYSPVENVPMEDVQYPNLIVTIGWNDIRVPYWEGLKWIARLREHQTSVILCNWTTGHLNRTASKRGKAIKYALLELSVRKSKKL